jgi:hypothetical protein
MTASLALMLAGGLSIVTALIHSILGEKRLISPQIAAASGVMKNSLARNVTRFAWHWTTILWFLVAAVLIRAGLGHAMDSFVLLLIGVAHIIMGLFDALLTRGRHIGWPLITLIGVFTLFACFSN